MANNKQYAASVFSESVESLAGNKMDGASFLSLALNSNLFPGWIE